MNQPDLDTKPGCVHGKAWWKRNPCMNAGGKPKKRYKHDPFNIAEAIGDDTASYRCPICGYWHVGHPIKAAQ